jgi:hypothetical protein
VASPLPVHSIRPLSWAMQACPGQANPLPQAPDAADARQHHRPD